LLVIFNTTITMAPEAAKAKARAKSKAALQSKTAATAKGVKKE
jgi:hypothetical protein